MRKIHKIHVSVTVMLIVVVSFLFYRTGFSQSAASIITSIGNDISTRNISALGGTLQVGDSSISSAVSSAGTKISRRNGGIQAEIHQFVPSNNSPTYQSIWGGNW